MIQDIYPHVYHNEYKHICPDYDSIFLFYDHQQILVKNSDPLEFFTWGDLKTLLPEYSEYLYDHATYLFSVDQTVFFIFREPVNRCRPDHTLWPSHEQLAMIIKECAGRFEPVSFLRNAAPGHLAFAGITGFQLHNWYTSHRFCGKCSNEMVHSEKERMMHCEQCGHMEYPQLCPAVIVAVTHGDKLLLTKYEGRAFKRYALIAGYAEIGETIEQTVHREVMEEVGLKVKNLTYYKSQPWSFSGTLLFGFCCEVDGDDTITLDREELSVGEWVSRQEVPVDGENTSLTREMMEAFKNGIF